MTTYPRVSHILDALDLRGNGLQWVRNKHFRRGRLVEDALFYVLANESKRIPSSWWAKGSGDPSIEGDYMPHEECRPHIEAGIRWIRESGFVMTGYQVEVKSDLLRYIGHIDFTGYFPDKPQQTVIIDCKCGDDKMWHRLQVAFYKLAYAESHKEIALRGTLVLPAGKYIPHNDIGDLTAASDLVRAYHHRVKYGEKE